MQFLHNTQEILFVLEKHSWSPTADLPLIHIVSNSWTVPLISTAVQSQGKMDQAVCNVFFAVNKAHSLTDTL